SLALKTLDDIELNKKAMFARVMAAHFTTYYYVGFSYMMMHRYSDAIRMFSHILVYVSRTKNFQKSAQYDSITKKNEQMYALIAICVAFQPTRLDDTIHTALREKYGDQLLKLQRGGPESLPIFEELFRTACPKFISPTPPDFENPEANIDPVEHHLSIFMDEVKTNMWSPTIKSYLRLYTTMDLNKLSGFLDVKPDELRAWLLVSKQRTKQLRWSENSLLDGDLVNVSDLDYAMQNLKYALEPRNVRSLTFTVPTQTPTPTSTPTLNPDMSEPLPAQQSADVKSPDSGISPRTVIQGSSAAPDYFPPPNAAVPEASLTSLATTADTQDAQAPADAAGDTETHAQAPAPAQKPERPRIQIKGQDAALRPDLTLQSPSSASIDSGTTVRPSETGRERKASISSLSFAPLHNPALPQGTHKKTDKTRIRASSPPPNRAGTISAGTISAGTPPTSTMELTDNPAHRFQSHVAFDNLPLGEATKSNTPSLTLNVRHRGYQAKRRSRTFMVGVDEHAYSDYALQWLLDELVDDGDEVVCVRVVDKDMRSIGASYQDDAQAMMDAILEKNGANRAISVVLEYACGKLHSTFQKL
ncbi:hypothetical protein BN1723_017888, partial [Verticillium longisporum]